MYNYEERNRTGKLSVVVNVDSFGEIDIVSINDCNVPLEEKDGVDKETDLLTDVGWCEEFLGMCYLATELFGDEVPEEGSYKVTGIIISDRSWGDYGWEYDSRFEIDSVTKIGS